MYQNKFMCQNKSNAIMSHARILIVSERNLKDDVKAIFL